MKKIFDIKNENLPMGLGMALSRNIPAMQIFSALPREEQEKIIDRTHGIQSKEEMNILVGNLISEYNPLNREK